MHEEHYILNKRSKIAVMAVILVAFIYCVCWTMRFQNQNVAIKGFYLDLAHGNWIEAEKKLNECRKTTPILAYYGYMFNKKYISSHDHDDIQSALFYLSKAIQSSPEDIALQHDYAMTLYLSGDKLRAITMLRELCVDFPSNSLMQASLGNMLYLENCKGEAIPHLVFAIESTPSVIETDSWTQFLVNDSISAAMILKRIYSDMKMADNDPIKCAKFGKIAYLCGDNDTSEELLTKAVAALPNLQAPWEILWKIKLAKNDPEAGRYLKKAEMLGYNKEGPTLKLRQSVIIGNNPLPADPELYVNRDFKFQTWYSVSWHPEMAVF